MTPTNAQIYPPYNAPSDDEMQHDAEYRLLNVPNEVLVEVALGKKITYEGKTLNNTYQEWLSNLNYLEQVHHISHDMKFGFRHLNKYNRSENENEPSNNPEPNPDIPPEFYPPYTA